MQLLIASNRIALLIFVYNFHAFASEEGSIIIDFENDSVFRGLSVSNWYTLGLVFPEWQDVF